MGSDLSFEDLTNRDIEDYDYIMLNEEESCSNHNEQLCYKLLSKPKDKSSEYSKHITWVNKDTFTTFKEESYDKEGILLKVKNIQYQKMEEYFIMSELFVKNVQKNHTTLLTIDKISINLNVT